MNLPLREQKGVTAKENRRNGEEALSLVKSKEVEVEEEEYREDEATSVEATDTTMAAIFRCVRLYLFIMNPQRNQRPVSVTRWAEYAV